MGTGDHDRDLVQREKHLDERERDLDRREAALTERVAEAELILAAADQRDTDADERDDVADALDLAADRKAFLSSDPEYGGALRGRRHAALDRVRAQDDRSSSAHDRETLTGGPVTEPDD